LLAIRLRLSHFAKSSLSQQEEQKPQAPKPQIQPQVAKPQNKQQVFQFQTKEGILNRGFFTS
jgi:hypothetical protein